MNKFFPNSGWRMFVCANDDKFGRPQKSACAQKLVNILIIG